MNQISAQYEQGLIEAQHSFLNEIQNTQNMFMNNLQNTNKTVDNYYHMNNQMIMKEQSRTNEFNELKPHRQQEEHQDSGETNACACSTEQPKLIEEGTLQKKYSDWTEFEVQECMLPCIATTGSKSVPHV